MINPDSNVCPGIAKISKYKQFKWLPKRVVCVSELQGSCEPLGNWGLHVSPGFLHLSFLVHTLPFSKLLCTQGGWQIQIVSVGFRLVWPMWTAVKKSEKGISEKPEYWLSLLPHCKSVSSWPLSWTKDGGSWCLCSHSSLSASLVLDRVRCAKVTSPGVLNDSF